MKNLPNEKFVYSDSAMYPGLYDRINFSDLAKIKSPCCILFKPGFTKSICVGYQTNIVRLVSSLTLLGGKGFLEYLKEFSSYINVEFELTETIESNLRSVKLFSIEDIDHLLSILSKHRDQLKVFIDQLKVHRPKELSATVENISNLGIEKFYISYLEYSESTILEPFIVPVKSPAIAGSFNIEYEFNVPSNYDQMLEFVSNKIDSFGLEFAINEIVDEFKRCNDNIFDPSYYTFMTHSIPMYYGFVFDLVFDRVKRLVRMNVN